MTRRRLLVLLLLGAGIVAWLARDSVFRSVGRFLVAEQAPAAADAIVVLAGSLPDRVLEAVTLYHDGFAPLLVLSREPPPRSYAKLRELGVSVPTPHEINLSIARQLGVPESALLETGGQPGSTMTEAEDLIRFLWSRDLHRILLVTSKYHTRRAGQIYRHLGGNRLEVLLRPSRFDAFDPERWWTDRVMARRLVIEYQKILLFQLFDRWRFAPLATESPKPAPTP